MAGAHTAAKCPNCQGEKFREEKVVILDSSVVIRSDLPVEARTLNVEYQYICTNCNQVLDQPWLGHHES